ncbi:Uncharacterized protein putative in bacteria [Rubellimicrobium thermophilum DSM 16684]|uniref:Uncharacterized protein putative in bacteria n=1 Tax=Rubellimicrobium thermophilum DSM 16684 TaxID=1123069 RepID=S9R3Z2_9RHOB|nr:CsbD family protein [Rubellimicrobium thermophilum]EPX86713.1 Uncharacterized protein putative in bacteria [Rubellimicrobium thermophilum DSM 16684]
MANESHIKGAANTIAGKIKEGVGKLTGNPELEAEGKAEQVKGKVQKTWGDVKDAASGKS